MIMISWRCIEAFIDLVLLSSENAFVELMLYFDLEKFANKLFLAFWYNL